MHSFLVAVKASDAYFLPMRFPCHHAVFEDPQIPALTLVPHLQSPRPLGEIGSSDSGAFVGARSAVESTHQKHVRKSMLDDDVLIWKMESLVFRIISTSPPV